MDDLFGFRLINHMLAMSCMVVWLLKQAVKGITAVVGNVLALKGVDGAKEAE